MFEAVSAFGWRDAFADVSGGFPESV